MLQFLSLLILAVAFFAPKHESLFACNLNALSASERTRHFVELGPKLRSLKTGVRELKDGYEFRFPSDPKTIALLAEWMAQEHLCCPFFQIELRVEPNASPAPRERNSSSRRTRRRG